MTSRTFDILPTVGQVATVLHPGLNLADKVRQIMVRLEVGLPASLVEIASHVGTLLARRNYLRLGAAGLGSIDALESAADEAILGTVDGSKEKLAELQSRLGDMQGQIGMRQGDFGAKMGKLGAMQGELGAKQGRLGEEQGRIAGEADRKVIRACDGAGSHHQRRPHPDGSDAPEGYPVAGGRCLR